MLYKIKRKSVILMEIILFVMAVIIIFAICFLFNNFNLFNNSNKNVKNGEVIIIGDKSFLNNFEIVGKEVHIYYEVSLKNNSDSSKTVKLVGDFQKEVDNGLLKSNILEARFIDLNDNSITINGNSEIKYIKIEFVGEHAESLNMSSRNLPYIEVIEE